MSNLNQILLQPTDVLFFRDGRPMGGSLAGHTTAWPLPDVTNHALHAALHRAGLDSVHGHDHINAQGERTAKDNRKFGSLITAGPFPVDGDGRWFFPRPKDAQTNESAVVTLKPISDSGSADTWTASSLPEPLRYAVGSMIPPDKEASGEPWISGEAFSAYLQGTEFAPNPNAGLHFLKDDQIADREHQIGIGIDPETQSQDGKNFYSAHYLRLREGFRLGLFAEAMDKISGEPGGKRDLIKAMLNGQPEMIVVGGQQRICSARREDVSAKGPPMPYGLNSGFSELPDGKFAVKWVLLTPAIWPEIAPTSRDGRAMTPHPGGWLPNWIHALSGAVLLRLRSGLLRRDYSGPRAKRVAENDSPVGARLVAAVVPKPIPVTGWALSDDIDRPDGGAKSIHLAVPAGAVYYFEADSAEEAAKLAAALNWHGDDAALTTIKNRRSTLMGEKGFGLGVCGTWEFFPEVAGRSEN